jgi:hypothetical protein
MLEQERDDLDHELALHGRSRTLVTVAIVAIVAFGVAVRFWSKSSLWLDEALTVDIAKLPLHQIPSALKRDGAPPAFYVLLHFWIRLFGDSDTATRALSGLVSTATLPVAWLAARRIGGKVAALTTLVLLASAPFAVYYATEARMYALVMLLTVCGLLALERALERPRPGNLVAIAVVTAALLYSQYWSLYLVAMVAAWLVVLAWQAVRRDGGPALRSSPHFAALCALAAGCLLFVPWLPTFVSQNAHTGTPWAKPPNFSAVINAVTGYTDNQASLYNVVTNQSRLLALIYVAMAALALFGVARSRHHIDLDLHTVPRARSLAIVTVATLFAAIAGGLLSGSAFSSRYASVVFFPFLLVVALGTTTLLSPKLRLTVLALAVASGVISCVQNVSTQRTQAPQIAAVLNARAHPGDVVAFCPDQLGPSVSRLTADSGRFTMVTFPRGTAPQFVDWVDYLNAVDAGNPAAFASSLLQRAGPHEVWLVWQVGYQGYGAKCAQVAADLLQAPGVGGHNFITDHPKHFYEPMNLTEFAPGTT